MPIDDYRYLLLSDIFPDQYPLFSQWCSLCQTSSPTIPDFAFSRDGSGINYLNIDGQLQDINIYNGQTNQWEPLICPVGPITPDVEINIHCEKTLDAQDPFQTSNYWSYVQLMFNERLKPNLQNRYGSFLNSRVKIFYWTRGADMLYGNFIRNLSWGRNFSPSQNTRTYDPSVKMVINVVFFSSAEYGFANTANESHVFSRSQLPQAYQTAVADFKATQNSSSLEGYDVLRGTGVPPNGGFPNVDPPYRIRSVAIEVEVSGNAPFGTIGYLQNGGVAASTFLTDPFPSEGLYTVDKTLRYEYNRKKVGLVRGARSPAIGPAAGYGTSPNDWRDYYYAKLNEGLNSIGIYI
jgi:hypothetical protein